MSPLLLIEPLRTLILKTVYKFLVESTSAHNSSCRLWTAGRNPVRPLCIYITGGKELLEEYLPKIVLEDLLYLACRDLERSIESLDLAHTTSISKASSLLFQLLMTNHCRHFRLDAMLRKTSITLSKDILLEILCTNAQGLYSLELPKLAFWENDLSLMSNTLFPKLRNIRILTLCTQFTFPLHLIGSTCSFLEKVHLKGRPVGTLNLKTLCCNVDDTGIQVGDHLYPCCLTLRELHIPSGIRIRHDEEECLFFLFRRLLNLHSISYFESLLNVFLILISEALQKGERFITSLRKIQDFSTEIDRMKVFSTVCPELNQLDLLSPDPSAIQGLKYFDNLSHLELDLVDSRFRLNDHMEIMKNDFVSYIEEYGSRIKFLKTDRRYFGSDLKVIGTFCTCLEELSLIPANDIPTARVTCSKIVSWPKLTHISIYAQTLDSAHSFRNALSDCRLIQYIKVRVFTHELSDNDIQHVIYYNRFLELEHWDVTCQDSQLTHQSLELLIEKCPSLQKVSKCTTFNITPAQKTTIENNCRKKNWKIYIED